MVTNQGARGGARLSAGIILILLPVLSLRPATLERTPSSVAFEHISIDKGLSQSIVKCLLRDRKGFIWLGTEDGLNKYDGYDFRVLRHDPKNPDSLSYNDITALSEDDAGRIWIGTFQGGLNRFDPVTERNVRYRANPSDPRRLSHDNIRVVFRDRSGGIWVGTEGGLNKYDPAADAFVRYMNGPEAATGPNPNLITAIAQDAAGALWIGTPAGLHRFDSRAGLFTLVSPDPRSGRAPRPDSVSAIAADPAGILWIGTSGGGLIRFDPRTEAGIRYRCDPSDPGSLGRDYLNVISVSRAGDVWIGTDGGGLSVLRKAESRFIRYRHDDRDPESLAYDEIRSILEDGSGIFWIGTYGRGVDKYNPGKRKFSHYRFDSNNPDSISHPIVWTICEDRFGELWIGTHGGGLDRLNRKTGRVVHYRTQAGDPGSLPGDIVRCVYETRDGTLWIGTHGGGLARFERETNRFVRYPVDEGNPASLSHNQIRCITEDRFGLLWIGTYGGGLNKFDRGRNVFTRYRTKAGDSSSLSHDIVRVILEDPAENGRFLWIGTEGGGLNRFDRQTEKFTRFQNDPDNPRSLSKNHVFALIKDKAGALWIGTFAGGLNRLDEKTGLFTRYTTQDGLPSNSIYGILADDRGGLWMSTTNGLSRFDLVSGTFDNFTMEDGLQSNEFNGGAHFKSRTGEMFFGGIFGFNAFFPERIRKDTFVPPIVLSGLEIFSNRVTTGEVLGRRPSMPKSITYADILRLSYRDHTVTLDFAALHFAAPSKNVFAYQLVGVDGYWHPIGTRHSVTYSNLQPGSYVFRVKGANSDGVWNEEGVSLKIQVIPPFWKTTFFKLLMAALILCSVFGWYEIRLLRLRTQRRKLETLVVQRTEEIRRQKAEVTQTNIVLLEEIRVRQNAEELVRASLKEKEILLREIHHRVKNNMQIISSLLSLQGSLIKDEGMIKTIHDCQSRIQTMSLIHEKLYRSLSLSHIGFAEYISSLVQQLFHIRRIQPDKIGLNLDLEEIELNIQTAIPCGLMVNELISNSLKYAFPDDRRGEIRVAFHKHPDGCLMLEVGDDGVGLPKDLDIQKTTTLGLQLVTMFVNQLDGSMEIDREKGTAFKIRFQEIKSSGD